MIYISHFFLQILPDFFYTRNNRNDEDIVAVVDKIYNTYISNQLRCVGTEVRAEPVDCLCWAPEGSGAYYGYPCDSTTRQFDTSRCVFSRCKV
jgi:hypothetical protein